MIHDAYSDPYRLVIARLEECGYEPRPTGPDRHESRCPGHDGEGHSLSLAQGDDGRALAHCHAHGCGLPEILAPLGLTMADLFPRRDAPPAAGNTATNGRVQGKAKKERAAHPTPEDAIAGVIRAYGRPTRCDVYRAAAGGEAFRVFRFDFTDPKKGEPRKTFRPVHQTPAGWVLGDPPGPLPLYRLPGLADAGRVYLTEGEKGAELVRGLGLVATTSAHGADSADKTDWGPLAGKEVVILPDHDDAGEEYAAEVVGLLSGVEPPPTVRLLRLPAIWHGPAPPDKGDDVEQWLSDGVPEGWDRDRCRSELERAADAAPAVDLTRARPEPAPAPGHGRNGTNHASPRDTGDDDSEPVPERSWPEPPDDQAYHGLAGEVVRAIEPDSEADPLAVLIQILLMFGNLIGRSAHFAVEATRHHANEFAVLVGLSSQGRKGTAWDRARAAFDDVDPSWARHRIQSGLSSGKGLISAVCDPVYAQQPVREKGRVVEYQEVQVNAGVEDKRLMVHEPEFAGVLRALEREGNKLSALIRQAWESGNLCTLTKSPLRATGAHVSIIGHVTEEELLSLMSAVDSVNGFTNRFLWLAVRRTKMLPFGGSVTDLSGFSGRLADAACFARDTGRMKFSHAAGVLWADHYARLTTPPPGVLGGVTRRAAPHVIRLAMTYALLDRSATITDDHLAAALALWDASARCAAYIFGGSVGNGDADKVLAALRKAPGGLTMTEIRSGVFQRNKPAPVIRAALAVLMRHNLAREEKDENTGGRPAYRYHAADALNALNALRPPASDPRADDPRPLGVKRVNGVTLPASNNGDGHGRTEEFEV